MDNMLTTKIVALIAGVTGMCASIAPALPDSDTIDSLGRWPLTVILGAVCVTCVYFMYRQSRENGRAILTMVEGERLAAEHRIIANMQATKELAENNARVVKELAENNSKELRILLDEICKKTDKQR
jgi:hypothetical protein